MVGHSSRQDTFLCQLLSLGVPAEHSGNDLILLIPPTGDVQPVVAGRNATAGSLVTELCHQTPAIFQRAVGIERSHGATCKERTRMLGIFLGLSSLTTRVLLLLLIRPDLPSYQRYSRLVASSPESQDGSPTLLRCKLHLLSILTGWESGSKSYLTEHSCQTHLKTGSLGTPAGASGISAWLRSHLRPYTPKSVLQITKGPCTEAIHKSHQPGNS